MSVFVLFTISSGKYKKEHTNIDSVDHINENLVPWHILSFTDIGRIWKC